MTEGQRRGLSPDSEEYRLRVGGSKTQMIGWSLYTLLLWMLKTCMSVFYSRLTDGLANMQHRIKVAYALIGVTYIATILSILCSCHPFHRNWQIYPDPGKYCHPSVSEVDVYVTVVLNVLTDMYLISIPVPMLLKAQLPAYEKLELLILFSGGTFVMIAGIIRAVLILTAGPNGAQQAGSWACRETFVAIVINNAPMIYPIMRRTVLRKSNIFSFSSLKGHFSGGTSRREAGQSHSLEQWNNSDTDRSASKKRKKFRHPLSLPTNIMVTNASQTRSQSQWDNISEEQMILPTFRQQPPTCTAEEINDASESTSCDGIKVTQETIVVSKEKKRQYKS